MLKKVELELVAICAEGDTNTAGLDSDDLDFLECIVADWVRLTYVHLLTRYRILWTESRTTEQRQ